MEEIDWWSREAIEARRRAGGPRHEPRACSTRSLKASEVKYRELVESANSIILKVDDEGAVTFMNEYAQSVLRVFGRRGTREEPHRDHRARNGLRPGGTWKRWSGTRSRTRDAYINNENENVKKNGERVWVAWTNRAILDEEGRLAGMLAVGNDVTERRRGRGGTRAPAATSSRSPGRGGTARSADGRVRVHHRRRISPSCSATRRSAGSWAGTTGASRARNAIPSCTGRTEPPEYCATVQAVRDGAEYSAEVYRAAS